VPHVDKALEEQTFVMWVPEHARQTPFSVWPLLDPVRTVAATFESFVLYAQTDFLSRDDLLEMVASVEELDGKDDP
jgi:hypothetical protein